MTLLARFSFALLVVGHVFFPHHAIGQNSMSEKAPFRILALGDSLTAGYGLTAEDGFTHQLEAALNQKQKSRGYPIEIINAGVSGDTSAGGRGRIAWLVSDTPDAAIVALGANDGLQGLPPEEMEKNLSAILDILLEKEIESILFIGMLAPPNMGERYGQRFNAVFPQLAQRYNVVFYPFFLEGVAAEPDLNQADGIHPNKQGVSEIVKRLLPKVEKLLGETEDPSNPS